MPHLQSNLVEKPPVSAASRSGGLGALAVEISLACTDCSDTEGRMRAALERAVGCPDLLTAAQCEPQADTYARRVLYSDPFGRFTVLAIVWGPGQFSPVHAHHTWCAYAVYDGSLKETLYSFNQCASKADAVCTKVRNPGYSCYAGAGLDQIHRLGNAGTTPAVSIHVYGVERERISTHVNRVLEAG